MTIKPEQGNLLESSLTCPLGIKCLFQCFWWQILSIFLLLSTKVACFTSLFQLLRRARAFNSISWTLLAHQETLRALINFTKVFAEHGLVFSIQSNFFVTKRLRILLITMAQPCFCTQFALEVFHLSPWIHLSPLAQPCLALLNHPLFGTQV